MSPPMKRIAVFGNQDYLDRYLVERSLDKVLSKHGPFVLLHCGTMSGVDRFAGVWAQSHPEVLVTEFTQGAAVRYIVMLSSGADGAVAFGAGPRVQTMTKLCAAAGVKVWFPNDE